MAEYIEREAAIRAFNGAYQFFEDEKDVCRRIIKSVSAADVAPVVHGRWIECEDYSDDAYYHHKCSNCNVVAPFDYKYREDWDEGLDGEWFFLGMIDDGIIEHITPYCPNCGARMDGGACEG